MPVVRKISRKHKPLADDFPMKYYSTSSMKLFSTNPILFKIRYINGETIDSTHSPAMTLGNAFHNAMEVYYGGSDYAITSESEAIEMALKTGLDFIDSYPDGLLAWNTAWKNKQQMMDKFSFCFNSYIQEVQDNKDDVFSTEQDFEQRIAVKWRGEDVLLPVPLKGKTDRIDEIDGKLKIVDYKTCPSFSDPDKIDAKKIIQAVNYYFLVYAKEGREPYSIIYHEIKHTKNKDGGPQVRTYEVVFAENELFFDFYLRYYWDITQHLNGNAVYPPNFDALYDNEIAVVAYIHGLDITEEAARQMKKTKVTNITELLKDKIVKASSMKKLMRTVEKQFISGKTMDYDKMTIEQRIEAKMAEHGMRLTYSSTLSGSSVDLYRFVPNISIKMSRIASYSADIEQVVGISGIRVLAPIPNSKYVGFEIPRGEGRTFCGTAPAANGVDVPVGVNTKGDTIKVDLTEAPHILIAGTTGGGKSVMLRSMLDSIGSNADFWLADPKGVELHDISAKRHAEQPGEIRELMEDLAIEMDRRYNQMKKSGARKWGGRKIVCVVDEFGDFIISNPGGYKIPNYHTWTKGRLLAEVNSRSRYGVRDDLSKSELAEILTADDERKKQSKYMELSGEELVIKLAQKARAAGIHMILATQRPSVDVITGTIKANFPTRIALRTASEADSRVILDQPGAEKLTGKGDALLLKSDSSDLIRIQGFNV